MITLAPLATALAISRAARAISSGGATLVFLHAGESNSGGQAANASATAPELSSRPEVQILNTSTMLFESLHVGFNNNLDHANLTPTTHGIELELANAVAAGRFAQSSVYLVQTGQGASNIRDWDVGAASGFWTKFLARVNAAKAIFAAQGKTPIWQVFYSQGINDHDNLSMYGGAGATTDPDTWKTLTIAHLAKIRTELGANTLIVMTRFNLLYDTFNAKIDEIVAADANCRVIEVAHDLEYQLCDGLHWNYAGMKALSQANIDAVLEQNGITTAPVITPVSGEYAGSQTVAISGSGTIKSTSDIYDSRLGAVYSGSFSQAVPATVRAVSVERNKRTSPEASAVFTSGSAWRTDDASGVAILGNGNLDLGGRLATGWKTIRSNSAKSSGLLYVEIECIGQSQESGFMLGFASAGFGAYGYLGSSDYSFGLFASGAQYVSTGFTVGAVAGPSGVGVRGRVYQFAVNFTSGKIWYGENNTFSGSPVAGTGQVIDFVPGTVGAIALGISFFAKGNGVWRLRTASAQLVYSPPAGFTAWG